MNTGTVDDIRNFAERVERLCDFLLKDLKKDGSHDVTELQDLQKDAADFQRIYKSSNVSIEGLSEYIRGHPIKTT